MSNRNHNQNGSLNGFIGGTLNQRLRRSTRERSTGSLEASLVAAIEEGLTFGEQAATFGERPEPVTPKELTPEEQADMQRQVVREIVAGSSGASRVLRREDRLRREARQQELERQRVQRESSDVVDDLMEEDVDIGLWMESKAAGLVADDDIDDDDDLDTQVYW